jgi:hypothetical protein
VHLAHSWKIKLFLALSESSSTGSIWLLPVLECLKRAKNSLIFQKCAKCTLTLMSHYEIIFDYKFRFYTSKMNEICLHCHWLYFSSIILSFGQCECRMLALALPYSDLPKSHPLPPSLQIGGALILHLLVSSPW